MLEKYIIDFLNSTDYSLSIYTNDSSCHYCYKLKVCLTESNNLTNFDGSAALGDQVCVCVLASLYLYMFHDHIHYHSLIASYSLFVHGCEYDYYWFKNTNNKE